MSTQRRGPSGTGKPAPEIVYTGIPKWKYQELFNSVAGDGFRLRWFDGYDVRGETFFNVIFQSDEGIPWIAHHGLTERELEDSRRRARNYKMAHLTSYRDGNDVRYAVVYLHSSWPGWNSLLDSKADPLWNYGGWTYYADLSATEHQREFENVTSLGYVPITVSVTSVGGKRRYAALYWHKNVGSFELKSTLGPQAYQDAFDRNVRAGRGLASLDAYRLGEKTYFAAIWNADARGPFAARHDLTQTEYEREDEKWRARGYRPRIVTGYPERNSSRHRFAASWRK